VIRLFKSKARRTPTVNLGRVVWGGVSWAINAVGLQGRAEASTLLWALVRTISCVSEHQ